MGGPELAERLAETTPGLKVLFMSGYTGGTAIHREMIDPEADFLQKPFAPELLTQRLRDVHEARQPA